MLFAYDVAAADAGSPGRSARSIEVHAFAYDFAAADAGLMDLATMLAVCAIVAQVGDEECCSIVCCHFFDWPGRCA